MNIETLGLCLNEEAKAMLASFEQEVVAYAREADVPVDMVLEWLELPELDPMDIELIEIRHDEALFDQLERLWSKNIMVSVTAVGGQSPICPEGLDLDWDDMVSEDHTDAYLPTGVYFQEPEVRQSFSGGEMVKTRERHSRSRLRGWLHSFSTKVRH